MEGVSVMAIVIRINNNNEQLHMSFSEGNNKKEVKNSQFAGNWNLPENPIAQKRKEAQEKALKVVKDAWEIDKSIDASIQFRKEHYNEMKALQEEKVQSLTETNAAMEDLKQIYCVEADSKEQQDLELLIKRQDIFAGVSSEQLSKEELARLREIDKEPLTEYQSRALELNAYAGVCKNELRDIQLQMEDDIRDIRSIQLERLKSDPMVEAQNTADSIEATANKEIIGMILEEGKNQIDEKAEEVKEEAEKQAEEKEAKEELTEELQEKLAIQEAFIEGTKEAIEDVKQKQRRDDAPDLELTEVLELTGTTEATEGAKETLEAIKNSMNLLEADLKGIQVDEQI